MAQMTSKERVLAALRREDVDYVPFLARFNQLTETQRKGVYTFPWPVNDRVGPLDHCVNTLGTDIYVDAGISSENYFLSQLKNEYRVEGNLLWRTVHTPDGPLTACVERNSHWPYGDQLPFYSDFTAHFKKPWVEDAADVQKLRHILRPTASDPAALDACSRHFREAKALADRFRLPLACSGGMGLTMGLLHFLPEPLMILCMEDPDLIREYLRIESERSLENYKLAAELGADVIVRNGFYETADFYSPAMLEDLLAEPLKKELALIHSLGMLCTYTIHSGVMPLLQYLKQFEFDSLYGLGFSFPYMDPVRVRDELSGQFCIESGPDNTHEFPDPSPEPTRKAVRRVMEVFGRRGFILTPCVSMHATMPWDNFLAAVDEWKRLR